jgi:serine/threonine protein kinase
MDQELESVHHIKLLDQIGEGSYGTVFRGVDLQSGMEVAVKVFI